MKPGRPALREEFRRDILHVLGGYQYPATASTVKKLLDQRRQRPCGRDTVRKYLHELVEDHLVLREALPAGDGRKPLMVYQGRAAPTRGGRHFLATFSSD